MCLSEFAETFASCLARAGIRETRLPVQFGIAHHSWVEDWLMAFLLKMTDDAKAAERVFDKHRYNARLHLKFVRKGKLLPIGVLNSQLI